MKYCIARGIEVLVIPRIGDVIMSSARHRHMFHMPMLQVVRYRASLEYLFLKRLTDILISLTALVVLSPVMLVVAIAIKAYDRGPVLYSQVRLTKDAKEFRIYKFRSMRTDAEKDGVARLSTGDNDDRITPVGGSSASFGWTNCPSCSTFSREIFRCAAPDPSVRRLPPSTSRRCRSLPCGFRPRPV